MTVKVLIELLKECDSEAPIEITLVKGAQIFQIVSVIEIKYHYTELVRSNASKVELKAGD